MAGRIHYTAGRMPGRHDAETVPENLAQGAAGEARRSKQPLLVVSLGAMRRVVALEADGPVVLGRGLDVTLTLDDETLSRHHAEFTVEADGVWVRDLGSTNHTKVNGKVIERVRLRDGDEVQLGRATVSLHAFSDDAGRKEDMLGPEALAAFLHAELERATVLRRPVSVAALLPGAGQLDVVGLRAHLRSLDRVGLGPEGSLVLVLPEMTAATARAFVGVFAPGVPAAITAFPHDGVTAAALLSGARQALTTPTAPVARASGGPVFASAAMRRVLEQARRLATTNVSAVIHGETGTGKEVLARLLHDEGPRRTGPFVAMNCAAIPPTLIESVLFGHERGSFTGAVSSAPGLFEQAHRGTLLLDEVGELSLPAQAALLRVLETRQVRRVGGNREIPVDVRLLAATHRHLDAMVEQGSFRADLLYRLNAVQLELPPLRDRPEDVDALTQHFIARANEAHRRTVSGLTPGAAALVRKYGWPGNVRELKNAIEHAVVMSHGALIDVGDLPPRLATPSREVATAPPKDGLREDLASYESRRLLDALREAGGNRTEAARRLGIPVRTFFYRLKRLELTKGTDEPPEPRPTPPERT